MEKGNTKKQKRLTVEELKQFKGLEELSEAEANVAIDTLEKYALIMYEMYKKQLEINGRFKDRDKSETKD